MRVFSDFFGWVVRIWDRVSGAQSAYRMELIYNNLAEIKLQLDKLDDRVEKLVLAARDGSLLDDGW